MINEVANDPTLLQRIITGNESWMYSYDIETKAQLSQWSLPSDQDRKAHIKFSQMLRF